MARAEAVAFGSFISSASTSNCPRTMGAREFYDALILLGPAARIAALALLKGSPTSRHGGCSFAVSSQRAPGTEGLSQRAKKL